MVPCHHLESNPLRCDRLLLFSSKIPHSLQDIWYHRFCQSPFANLWLLIEFYSMRMSYAKRLLKTSFVDFRLWHLCDCLSFSQDSTGSGSYVSSGYSIIIFIIGCFVLQHVFLIKVLHVKVVYCCSVMNLMFWITERSEHQKFILDNFMQFKIKTARTKVD